MLRPPDLGWLAALPARVRLVTIAPELEGAVDAIALLAASGRLVSLGHSRADLATAAAAAAAGARMVTHTFNAMGPLHHRAPGLAGAALTDAGLTPAVIGDGVHVHPAVLRLVLSVGPAVLVSDSVASESVRSGVPSTGGHRPRRPPTTCPPAERAGPGCRTAPSPAASSPWPRPSGSRYTTPGFLSGSPSWLPPPPRLS